MPPRLTPPLCRHQSKLRTPHGPAPASAALDPTSLKYIQKALFILVFKHKILFIRRIGTIIEPFHGRRKKICCIERRIIYSNFRLEGTFQQWLGRGIERGGKQVSPRRPGGAAATMFFRLGALVTARQTGRARRYPSVGTRRLSRQPDNGLLAGATLKR